MIRSWYRPAPIPQACPPYTCVTIGGLVLYLLKCWPAISECNARNFWVVQTVMTSLDVLLLYDVGLDPFPYLKQAYHRLGWNWSSLLPLNPSFFLCKWAPQICCVQRVVLLHTVMTRKSLWWFESVMNLFPELWNIAALVGVQPEIYESCLGQPKGYLYKTPNVILLVDIPNQSTVPYLFDLFDCIYESNKRRQVSSLAEIWPSDDDILLWVCFYSAAANPLCADFSSFYLP